MDQILLKPIITEKSMQDAASGRYTFAVHEGANKPQIAQAVANSFKVKVLNVQTMIVKGKTRRAGKQRREVVSRPWKKAVVAIPKEQKIEIFAVTENQTK